MVRSGIVAHRLSQPSLLLKPVFNTCSSLADCVGRNEITRHPAYAQLPGDCLAPFSQNSNELVCRGSGQAQPGQLKALFSWFIDSSALEPLSSIASCSRSALATARNAPHPPAVAVSTVVQKRGALRSKLISHG